MKNNHESFLTSFFSKMNITFPNKWCVLHSYESLPYFSSSDVDMAFSGNLTDLEQLIKEISNKEGWSLYQKLWYDSPSCFYYVLKENNRDNFLALDFLTDIDGIGKYGFETLLLTTNTIMMKNLFPIPNHEVAFCYKLVKRVVKGYIEDEDIIYLNNHLKNSSINTIEKILIGQFGEYGITLLNPYLKDGNIKNIDLRRLLSLKNKKFNKSTKKFKRFVWEIRRKIYRIFHPCGMIIHVQNHHKDDLQEQLSKRCDILFRHIKISSRNRLKDTISLFGSTLIIKLDTKNVIQKHWIYAKYIPITKECSLYDQILNILADRIKSRI